jgi:urea transport system permease protein
MQANATIDRDDSSSRESRRERLVGRVASALRKHQGLRSKTRDSDAAVRESGWMQDEMVWRFRTHTVLALLGFMFVIVPALNLLGIVDNTHLNKLGRYLCFAIVALGIDLLWGYAGLLSLCQALFFCLGGYAMAMHLSLPQGGGDVRPEYNNIPQFFFFNNVDTLPAWWAPFASLPFTLGSAIAIPALFAAILGFSVFRSRVKGVYFSIITQAVAWGAFLLFCRNEMLLGGTNGLTNFNPILNRNQGWILFFYLLTAAILTGLFLLARLITKSRLGRLLVGVRDKEILLGSLGYRPESVKLFAFVTAAVFAAIGGMLYVPQNGIITPNIMRVEDSIWMIVWVALGGRGCLWGAIIGALVVNYGYSAMTSDIPRAWPFVEGGMFIALVLFFPGGLAGLWAKLETQIASATRLQVASVGLAVAATVVFFVAEALGLVPRLLQASWMGAPVKYYLLFAVLGAAAFAARFGYLQQAVRVKQ